MSTSTGDRSRSARPSHASTAPWSPASRRRPALVERCPCLRPWCSCCARLGTAQEAERVHAANLWVETGLVFTTETGGPIDPRNVLRAATMAAAKARLDGVTVHTLRHSAATAMLEAGVHLKAVSEILGHADIRVTADVYGHVSTEVARAAMDALGDRMLAGD